MGLTRLQLIMRGLKGCRAQLGVTMKSDRNKIERRHSERSLLPQKASYEVSTHLISRNPADPISAITMNSQIKNVSEGGVCLATRQELETAQIVKISLPLPSVKTTTPTLAEVMWVRKDSNRSHYMAGLRFLL